jgi:hypothetical protein
MRDAILTLYSDDPICPQQLERIDEPDRGHDRRPYGFLASKTARLERLERELDLTAE